MKNRPSLLGGKCPNGCDPYREYVNLTTHFLTLKHRDAAAGVEPPPSSGRCPLGCGRNRVYAGLHAHKRTKMHRFAEMLARENARDEAEGQVVVLATPAPESIQQEGEEAEVQPVTRATPPPESTRSERKPGVGSCPLGCGGGREYSALARHKLTKMHVKAEAETKAKVVAQADVEAKSNTKTKATAKGRATS